MANYSREDAEKQGNAEVGLGATLLLGLGAMVLGSAVSSQNERKKQEEINRQIREIDKEIAEYKSRLFGSFMYSDEIAVLEQKRKILLEEEKKL